MRIITASAYLLGIPALYMVLTDDRKKNFEAYHGRQALVLWISFFVIFFTLRFFIDLVWKVRYIPWLGNLEVIIVVLMGLYAGFCAFRCLLGREFKIPH